MFSTLRTRFGIPGVISVIALVFAMIGGAYAASNTSSGGGKATASAKAKRGPRGPKGATGPAGPTGPAGEKGDAGANGSNGSNGSDGGDGQSVTSVAEPPGANCAAGGVKLTSASGVQYVCNGEDGEGGSGGEPSLPETLPSGQTETGTWGVMTNAPGGPAKAVISFPIPLEQELGATEVHYLVDSHAVQGFLEEGGPSAHCHGTVQIPLADPGHLCVYEARGEFQAGQKPINESITRPVFGEQAGSGRTGAILQLFLAFSDEYPTAFGTWAVTAP